MKSLVNVCTQCTGMFTFIALSCLVDLDTILLGGYWLHVLSLCSVACLEDHWL